MLLGGAEARPDVVLLAKQMHGQGMSLRKISAELAALGYVTAGGRPYVASAVQTMLVRQIGKAAGDENEKTRNQCR